MYVLVVNTLLYSTVVNGTTVYYIIYYSFVYCQVLIILNIHCVLKMSIQTLLYLYNMCKYIYIYLYVCNMHYLYIYYILYLYIGR